MRSRTSVATKCENVVAFCLLRCDSPRAELSLDLREPDVRVGWRKWWYFLTLIAATLLASALPASWAASGSVSTDIAKRCRSITHKNLISQKPVQYCDFATYSAADTLCII